MIGICQLFLRAHGRKGPGSLNKLIMLILVIETPYIFIKQLLNASEHGKFAVNSFVKLVYR